MKDEILLNNNPKVSVVFFNEKIRIISDKIEEIDFKNIISVKVIEKKINYLLTVIEIILDFCFDISSFQIIDNNKKIIILTKNQNDLTIELGKEVHDFGVDEFLKKINDKLSSSLR